MNFAYSSQNLHIKATYLVTHICEIVGFYVTRNMIMRYTNDVVHSGGVK